MRHPDDLTDREREIALLSTRDGLTAREIAARLCIAESTVKNALSNVRSKLGTRNSGQLGWALASTIEPEK